MFMHFFSKITAKRRKLVKTFAGFHRDAINDKKLKPFNAWSHSSLSKIYACLNVAFRERHIRRFFTHIFLTEEDDDESDKSLSWKVNSCFFLVHCSYSMSFNLSNVGEVFWSWILKDCFYVTKNKQRCCLVFMLSTRREIRQLRHVVAVLHVTA